MDNYRDVEEKEEIRLLRIEKAARSFLLCAIHAVDCERAAGGEGLDADQVCECGLADLRTALAAKEYGG